MNNLIPKLSLATLCALFLLCASAQAAPPQVSSHGRSFRSPLHFADYNSEPRRPDGHVDGDALLARLKDLPATTYYWLAWHAVTDWDDFKPFLPKAAQASVEV